MLYDQKIEAIMREKDLESDIDPLSRSMIISDPEGRTIELSFKAIEKMNSRQTYELLKAVF